MNSEISQDMIRLEKIVSTITGRDIRDKKRDHKTIIARSIFYKIAYDFLKRSGFRAGAKSYIAKCMSKNHATILHSLKNFNNDISPYDMNRKVYDKCVEVFDSLAEVYTSIDERDVEIDSLKNKIIDLQLQLKEVRPYSSDIEALVNLIKKIPKEHIDTAEFRIKTLLKGFTIEPRNQKTEIISSFEGVTSF